MPALEDVSGLEVSQDLAFQDRLWKVQRMAWVLVGLVVAAAALGVLGGTGPLRSSSETAGGGALEVRFDRFVRFGAPTSIEIDLAAGDQLREIAVSRSWLDGYRIDGVLPPPQSVTALRDRYVFTFDVGSAGTARFALTPRDTGRRKAVVWGPADQRIELSQIVYP